MRNPRGMSPCQELCDGSGRDRTLPTYKGRALLTSDEPSSVLNTRPAGECAMGQSSGNEGCNQVRFANRTCLTQNMVPGRTNLKRSMHQKTAESIIQTALFVIERPPCATPRIDVPSPFQTKAASQKFRSQHR